MASAHGGRLWTSQVLKIPDRHYGRPSMRPLASLIIVSCLAVTIGVSSRNWKRA